MNSLRCPKENGGCGADNCWRIAIATERFILECTNCNSYRISLHRKFQDYPNFYSGPLDETGEEVED